MRVVRKYLLFTILLLIYVSAVSMLLQYFYLYQKAYYGLSLLIAHPSMERSMNETEKESWYE